MQIDDHLALIPEHIYNLIAQNKFSEAIQSCQNEGIKTAFIEERIRQCAQKAHDSFEKCEYEQSIESYISTIGFIDPSIVLWHFIEPHLSIHLTNYLIELHKRGFANKSHTGLLFLLFRNSDAKHKLQEFILLLKEAKEKSNLNIQILKKKKNNNNELELDPLIKTFHAGAAIDALIENEMEKEALEIAWILDSPIHIVSLLINYKHDYTEAANQISKHSNDHLGRLMLMQFGPLIMEYEDKNTIKIIEIATTIWCSQYKGKDDEYLKLFSSKPIACYTFLKSIINFKPTTLLANTLIAMVIPRDFETRSEFYGLPSIASEQLARDYIRNDKLPYDADYLIRVCSETKFISGSILLLEKQNRFHDIVVLLINQKKSEILQDWIKKNPLIPDEDWVEIFHYFVRVDGWLSLPQNQDSIGLIQFIIKNTLKTIPIASILEELSNNDFIPIDVVRDLLDRECKEISKKLIKEEELNIILNQEMKIIDEKINELEEKEISFSPKDCDACSGKLDRHFIGFMCKHMFHVGCANKNGDEYFCPICGYSKSPFLLNNNNNLDDDEFGLNELINLNENNFDIDLNSNDLLDQIVDLIKKGFLDE